MTLTLWQYCFVFVFFKLKIYLHCIDSIEDLTEPNCRGILHFVFISIPCALQVTHPAPQHETDELGKLLLPDSNDARFLLLRTQSYHRSPFFYLTIVTIHRPDYSFHCCQKFSPSIPVAVNATFTSLPSCFIQLSFITNLSSTHSNSFHLKCILFPFKHLDCNL